MIFPWWLLVALLVVLLTAVLPPCCDAEREPEGVPASNDMLPAARRRIGRSDPDNWLPRLRAAVQAGYYHVDRDPASPETQGRADCAHCFFWDDGFCRLHCVWRAAGDEACIYFHEGAAVCPAMHPAAEESRG